MQTITQSTNSPIPFSIAMHEQTDWTRLRKNERLRIRNLLELFAKIPAFPSVKKACDTLCVTVSDRGFSSKSLQRLYKDYIDSNYDWSILVRNYRGQHKPKPVEFQKFIASLVSECKGRYDTASAVYDRLLNQYWFAGLDVPGYGNFKDFWLNKFPNCPFPSRLYDNKEYKPVGWSKKRILDLIAKLSPKDSQLRILTTQGFHAAHSTFEQLLRDRSNLKPMQLITFDDIEFDLQAVFKIGNEYQICNVQAVVALDVATGLILDYGVRPIYKDIATKKRRTLTREDTFAIFANLLIKHGLPANYQVNLLMENASATLLTRDKELIHAVLPNRFYIENTGILNKKLTANGFIEKGGMPYQKGWIEASFRPLLTRMSHIDGALAPRYDDRNKSHQKKVEYCLNTLNQATAMNINIDDIKLPILKEDELLWVLDKIINAFNSRVNHNLQGFEFVNEYLKQDGTFEDVKYLNFDQSALGTKVYRRKESPVERYNRLREENEFNTISPAIIAPFLMDRRDVCVRNNQISISDESFSADKLYYRGEDLYALNKQDVIACFSKDKSACWLFNKQDGYLGEARRLGLTDITDQRAIYERARAVDVSRKADVERVQEFVSHTDNRYKEIRVHNEMIFEQNKAIAEREKAITKTDKPKKVKINQDFTLPQFEDYSNENEEVDIFANLENFTQNP